MLVFWAHLVYTERTLAKADLLILDELSYLSFNRHQLELLFKVISDRSEKGSTIVTTNLPFSKWTDLFENTTMVAALLERLTFRTHVLNMKGESYHLQASLQGREEYAAYPWRNIRSELYSQPPFGSFLCDPECDTILNGFFMPPFSYQNPSIFPLTIYMRFTSRLLQFFRKKSRFFLIFLFLGKLLGFNTHAHVLYLDLEWHVQACHFAKI